MSFFDFFSEKVKLSPYASWNQNAITVAGWSNGTKGILPFQLNGPVGISINDDDTLYVSDTYNNRIVVVFLSTTKENFITESNSNQFNTPFDTSLTSTALYVSDHGNHRVQKLSLLVTNVTDITVPTLPYLATYLYVDRHDNIYLTGLYDHIVFVWNVTTRNFSIVAGTRENGTNNTELDRPYGIFVDDNNTVYVADSHNHRIMKWFAGASSGIMVAGTGTPGSNCTQLGAPTEIILDENEYMYISESANGRVTRWAPNSTCGVCVAACTGKSETGSTELFLPRSFAFDRNGSLYVSEFGNHRVQKFQILDHHSEYSIE